MNYFLFVKTETTTAHCGPMSITRENETIETVERFKKAHTYYYCVIKLCRVKKKNFKKLK